MTAVSRDPSRPVAATVGRYLTDKGKGEDGATGNYRSDAHRELDRFIAWARGQVDDPGNADPPNAWSGVLPPDADRDVRFSDLDARTFGDYARYLRALDVAPNTVHTYYAYVASWSDWAHRQGYLPRHYARESAAEDPLPVDDGRRPGDQQAWGPAHRDALARFVDHRADAALDEFGAVTVPTDVRGDRSAPPVRRKYRAKLSAVKALRDRVLALFCCYTGFRPAEFLDDPEDDREGRSGLRWSDVVLGTGGSDQKPYTTVYRKRQVWKDEPLPDPLVGPLRRYRRLLDPGDEWPVFTTFHRPSLVAFVTEELECAGYDPGDVDRLREGRPDLLAASELGLGPPPALTPNGARRVLKRLCEAGDVPIPDDGDYLLPHGGRRGMGEVFVREFGFAAAARYLDNSERQVRRAYQHIEAAERGEMATTALSRSDSRVAAPDDALDDGLSSNE